MRDWSHDESQNIPGSRNISLAPDARMVGRSAPFGMSGHQIDRCNAVTDDSSGSQCCRKRRWHQRFPLCSGTDIAHQANESWSSNSHAHCRLRRDQKDRLATYRNAKMNPVQAAARTKISPGTTRSANALLPPATARTIFVKELVVKPTSIGRQASRAFICPAAT